MADLNEHKETLVENIIDSYDLNDSLILGYYGGGNFGDELLLEILLAAFNQHGISNVKYMYSNEKVRSMFHHDFENAKPVYGKVKLLKEMFASRNLIMGGGGHWGMDANLNVLLLCIALFFMRFVFQKKVYLLGVGYYSSTNRIGRLAAWFAGKAANVILARDDESNENFRSINPSTSRGEDLAFSLEEIDQSPYSKEVENITTELAIKSSTELISFRRFAGEKDTTYRNVIESYIEHNPAKSYILTLFEPCILFPEYYTYIESLTNKFPDTNIRVMDYTYNPVGFFLYYKTVADSLRLIAPQYHGQLIAYLAGSSFIPIAYDNKVSQLHDDLKFPEKTIPLSEFKVQSINDNAWVNSGSTI